MQKNMKSSKKILKIPKRCLTTQKWCLTILKKMPDNYPACFGGLVRHLFWDRQATVLDLPLFSGYKKKPKPGNGGWIQGIESFFLCSQMSICAIKVNIAITWSIPLGLDIVQMRGLLNQMELLINHPWLQFICGYGWLELINYFNFVKENPVHLLMH